MTKPSFVSPVRCTSIVAFGSGRGISVSANSARGNQALGLPAEVHDHAVFGVGDHLHFNNFVLRGASCGSPYCSISLLISSAPAASSAAAAASASTAAVCACVSACACASSALPPSRARRQVPLPRRRSFGHGRRFVLLGSFAFLRGAAAADDTGLSGLKTCSIASGICIPVFCRVNPCRIPTGVMQGGLQRGREDKHLPK